MKSMYLKAFLPLLALTALGHADQSSSDKVKGSCRTNQSPFYQYNNRVVVFNPFWVSYERTEPNAFYAAVEGYVVPVINTENHNSKNFRNSWRHNFLLDSELRLGYNYLFNGRDHVTPFFGVGYLQKYHRQHNHTTHQQGLMYGALGVRYDHEFNSIFNLGLNAQFLVGDTITGKHHNNKWGTPIVGCDVSLPITFRFGYNRHWDIRIEPFDIYLHGSHTSRNYFGFRNTVAYRF